MTDEAVVFRSVAFPVRSFDYLKQFQRDYNQRHGVELSNNQALTIILKEHQQINAESEEHGHGRRNSNR